MMKFVKCKLYNLEVGFDEYKERKETLIYLKDVQVKILTRTQNEIDQGFKGIFPKLNGYTTEKNIKEGWIIEDTTTGVKYRIQRIDPVPRLTSLYLELV